MDARSQLRLWQWESIKPDWDVLFPFLTKNDELNWTTGSSQVVQTNCHSLLYIKSNYLRMCYPLFPGLVRIFRIILEGSIVIFIRAFREIRLCINYRSCFWFPLNWFFCMLGTVALRSVHSNTVLQFYRLWCSLFQYLCSCNDDHLTHETDTNTNTPFHFNYTSCDNWYPQINKIAFL